MLSTYLVYNSVLNVFGMFLRCAFTRAIDAMLVLLAMPLCLVCVVTCQGFSETHERIELVFGMGA